MHIKYLIGSVMTVPLLPIIYLQGKNIRKNVPSLPEATGTTGLTANDFTSTLHLLTLGESTIAGVGVATHKDGFTGVLATYLSHHLSCNVDWKVYARSGYTASKMSDKLVSKIEVDQVDIIVIGVGGNDAFTLSSPSKWRKNILQLITNLRLKYPHCPIVFVNMPPIKEFPAFTKLIKWTIGNLVEILGRELTGIVSDLENVYYNNEVIDLQVWQKRHHLQGLPKDIFFSDGVHPSPITYQYWAKETADFICKNNILRSCS